MVKPKELVLAEGSPPVYRRGAWGRDQCPVYSGVLRVKRPLSPVTLKPAGAYGRAVNRDSLGG